LHYVSSLPLDLRGGGYSLRNAAAFDALTDSFNAKYFGPFSPPSFHSEKFISASRRWLGMRGNFHFFSPRRLSRVRQKVINSGALDADLLFFNGFTPWIGIEPKVPYIAWNDCSFYDYIRIYHNLEFFDVADIERIEAKEAAWLRGAEAVVLRSRHFAGRAVEQYGLDRTRVFGLRNFSTLDPPAADTYAGEPLFLFMSTNFIGKNGPVVLQAFTRLRERYPQASLAIVGDMPPVEHRGNSEGVDWVGYLDPRDPAQDARKRDLLARAAMLVHPTTFDASPAVLVEAAYFGCPAISVKAFAIPEITENGETGWLVEDPYNADGVADRMAWLFEAPRAYGKMRCSARRHALKRMTLSRFKADLTQIVAETREKSMAVGGESTL